jgi:stage V sporulation protein G
MQVTEVRISPSKGGKVKAFASIVIDDCFIVNDLRVMEGREGQVFVTMPARKARSGQMRDIAHPLDRETRETIERRILEEYEAAAAALSIPDPGGTSARRSKDEQSLLDRLAARLFSEDYWTVELEPDERQDDDR